MLDIDSSSLAHFGLSFLGTLSVTIRGLRGRLSAASSVWLSTRKRLALSEASLAGRTSTVRGDPFFLRSTRSSSASTSGGNVGDSKGGSRNGDLGRLDEVIVSEFFGLLLLAGSTPASRGLFSPFLARLSLPPSRSRRRGDSNGGTECFGFTSTLMEPPRALSDLSEVPGRVPLASRDRGGGDIGRLVGVAVDFDTIRPLGRDALLADFPSFRGVGSRDDTGSVGLRLGPSSRIPEALSSDWRGVSVAFGLFDGRAMSSASLTRFLLSGEGGRGGRDDGFGGKLDVVSICRNVCADSLSACGACCTYLESPEASFGAALGFGSAVPSLLPVRLASSDCLGSGGA